MKYNDEYYMRLALKEAAIAFDKGEVPVGAVLVRAGKVVCRAHNMRESTNDPTAHAEVLVMRAGAIDSWRLEDATLYVTKEPCVMCAGTMVNSRLKRLVYGCSDVKGGAVGSKYRILTDGKLNHTAEVVAGVLEHDCAIILKRFFKKRRGGRVG